MGVFARQVIIPPGVLGLNGASLNGATPSSNWFGVAGFNQLMIDYSITDANSGISALTFFLQTRSEYDSTAKRLKIETATSASGVSTIVSRQFSCTVDSSNKAGSIPIAICHLGDMRIESVTGTSAGAADTVIVTVTLGVV